ncbi:hypothetical protein ASH00_15805 [Arthrobacter sp. Soil782]|nr:hypothetical protein ASH00_15805 [Arthrobacter sp. Soil782]
MNWTGKPAAAVAFIAILWFFAPTTLGGQTSYVSTHGASMQPVFQAGDLAVLRPAESYQVGDVVLYWSEAMETDVMHRIVDAQDGRFTLQGDNNSWLDPEQPREDEIIGKLMLRVPQGGIWLKSLTSPPMLALFTFASIATGSGAATRRSRKRKKASMNHTAAKSAKAFDSRSSRNAPTTPLWLLPTPVLTLAAVTALVAVLGATLAALAWTGPMEHSSTAPSASGAKMDFSYMADVEPSAAYDGTVVSSPDPVFRNVVDTVDVHFAYRGEPGTITVNAELSTPSGWRSTVALEDPESFTDNLYEGTVQLDLDELEAKARAAAEVTGMPSETVTIALTPHVATADSDFKPALELQLTPLQLALPGGPESLAVTDTAAAPAGEPRMVPRTIGTDSLNVKAGTAHWISAGMLLVAAVLGGVTYMLARKVEPLSESATIHRRHKALLVAAFPKEIPYGQEVTDVVAFAELTKLAERYEQKVVHWSHGGVETFTVKDENTVYRYRIGTPADESLAPLVGASA